MTRIITDKKAGFWSNNSRSLLFIMNYMPFLSQSLTPQRFHNNRICFYSYISECTHHRSTLFSPSILYLIPTLSKNTAVASTNLFPINSHPSPASSLFYLSSSSSIPRSSSTLLFARSSSFFLLMSSRMCCFFCLISIAFLASND